MFRIITARKNIGDAVVTQTYLSIIKDAIEDAGECCGTGYSAKGLDKNNDYLVFDECKVAFKYILLGYSNICIWIQGVVPEEALMKGYPRYRYWIHSFLEKIVLNRAKLVFMCSETMKEHYEKKYHISLDKKSFIMPCFNELEVDQESFAYNGKYLNNDFVYVGSLSAWQCFKETVEVYKAIETNSKYPCRLFVYTSEKEQAIRVLRKYEVENFSVDYVAAEKLGAKLRPMKYGFVLRRDAIVNQVATPTKLSNYISHGIIPIYSDCLRSFDYYNHVSKGPALVCNLKNINEGIKVILSNMGEEDEDDLKERMSSWCRETFASYYNYHNYKGQIATEIKKLKR